MVNYNPISTLNLEINLFRNDIKDLIDTRLIANKTNGQGVFSYYNVNNVYTQGLEFNTSWNPNNNLKYLVAINYYMPKTKRQKTLLKRRSICKEKL